MRTFILQAFWGYDFRPQNHDVTDHIYGNFATYFSGVPKIKGQGSHISEGHQSRTPIFYLNSWQIPKFPWLQCFWEFNSNYLMSWPSCVWLTFYAMLYNRAHVQDTVQEIEKSSSSPGEPGQVINSVAV